MKGGGEVALLLSLSRFAANSGREKGMKGEEKVKNKK